MCFNKTTPTETEKKVVSLISESLRPPSFPVPLLLLLLLLQALTQPANLNTPF